MLAAQWRLGLLLAAFAAHVLLAYRVYRLRARRDVAAGDGALPAADSGARRVVACPDCGTENERGYRYCRSCVAELPGSMAFRSAGDSPVGRLLG